MTKSADQILASAKRFCHKAQANRKVGLLGCSRTASDSDSQGQTPRSDSLSI